MIVAQDCLEKRRPWGVREMSWETWSGSKPGINREHETDDGKTFTVQIGLFKRQEELGKILIRFLPRSV